MWPTDSVWGNTLIFAAAGFLLILCAELGSVLGTSTHGRRVLRGAPVVLVLALVAYVAVVLLGVDRPRGAGCIYAPQHPSDCQITSN
jgi:hypothetical protein